MNKNFEFDEWVIEKMQERDIFLRYGEKRMVYPEWEVGFFYRNSCLSFREQNGKVNCVFAVDGNTASDQIIEQYTYLTARMPGNPWKLFVENGLVKYYHRDNDIARVFSGILEGFLTI